MAMEGQRDLFPDLSIERAPGSTLRIQEQGQPLPDRPEDHPDMFPPLPDAERESFERLMYDVPCRVAKVNEQLCKELGLNLEVGQVITVGAFLKFDMDRTKSPHDARVARVEDRHHRSALLNTEWFTTSDGDVLRDTDIKGSGLVSRATGKDVIPWHFERTPVGTTRMEGLLDMKDALYDMDMAAKFKALGVDVEEPLVVLEPLKLPVIENGRCGLVSVNAIPRKPESEILSETHGVLPQDFTPALLIRKFGTKSRVSDIVSRAARRPLPTGPEAEEDRRQDVRDAIEVVRMKHPDEFGVESDIDSYANWFARRLGRNVRLMLDGGYTHGMLAIFHNTTLDCRIPDRDSVIKHEGPVKYYDRDREFMDGRTVVRDFMLELFVLYPELLEWYGHRAEPGTSPTDKAVAYFEGEYRKAFNDPSYALMTPEDVP
jgi:hypothetical protein